MQDLFIKLVNSKDLEKVENLSAYARTVATNLAFDWRRKKSYRTHAHTDNIPEPAADQKDQLTLLQEDEQLRRIMEAAERLSKTQRQVFVLRYIEQQSFEQIAEAVGKTPHHVRALSSRALTRVRALCAKKSVRPMAQEGGWS
jgi:RNA polymerase sigma-70 factor (ECF subfamily)